MRSILDSIYKVSGAAAVVSLIAIGVLTLAQVLARTAGTIVPSADDFATFAMAGSIFLGLAHTYRAGGHVRVLTLQRRIPKTARRWVEAVCLGSALAVLAYLLWFTVDMIATSKQLNEHTLGLLTVPTWIPMLSMLIGVAVLLVAVADDFVVVLRNGEPSYASAESAEGLPPTSAE